MSGSEYSIENSQEMLAEIQELRLQLKEANSIIAAIRNGEVDALLVSENKQDQVYILHGADYVYREVIEEMMQGYVTLGLDGAILFCNSSFAQMLGYRLDQVIGTSFYELLSPVEANSIGQCLAHNDGFKGELLLQAGGGLPVPVLVSINFCIDGQRFAYMIVTDLTEQKKVQVELEKLNTGLEERVRERTYQLEEANRQIQATSAAKSAFLANMSHELRTPLNAIIGFSEVLKKEMFGPLNSKQAEYVEHVRGSGQHLLSLVNDLLDLSKAEAGMMELERSWINIREICQDSIAMLSDNAANRQVQLEMELDDAIDGMRMFADGRRIRQILYNLIGNGIKYNKPGGSVSVTVKRAATGGQISAIQLLVEDTGIGIAKENFALLFRPFSQLRININEPKEGTGLGLALTKHLVELHGGEIRVESEPDKGSRFIVWIPMRGEPV